VPVPVDRRRAGGRGSLALLALGALFALAAPLNAQTTDTLTQASLEVYLQCHDGRACDTEYFRQELTFVNWMLEPQDADVHIIVTTQRTGGGGRRFSLEFLGRDGFAGQDEELTYTSDATDTSDETRRGLLREIKLGLVPYLVATPLARNLDVVYEPPVGAPRPTTSPTQDPWKGWVFRVSGGGSARGESSIRRYTYNGNFSAGRTTDQWRVRWRMSGAKQHQEYDATEEQISGVDTTFYDTTYVTEQHSYNTSAFAAFSLAEHWSVGAQARASSASFTNRKLVLEAGPALEYSIFPYEEASSRQLLLVYQLTGSRVEYDQRTIFNKLQESLLRESLSFSLDATQPWGDAGGALHASHYLKDPADLFSLGFFGRLGLRIFRGLDLNLHGNVNLVRDQLYLPAESQSVTDILLQRQQLATDYQYSLSVGLSYRFGSKFNNIVNPRLGELN
jgi:hypothetical protein